MEKHQAAVLTVVVLLVLFILGIGVVAITSGFTEETVAEQPTVIINNYVTTPEQKTSVSPSSRSSAREDISERPTQSQTNYYFTSSYYPVAPYYGHYSRYHDYYYRYHQYPYDVYPYVYGYPSKYPKKIYY